MSGYILSVLGIVVAGVFIDIIIPSGSINKYIRGVYSIFVVAVLVSPIMKLMNKTHDFSIKFQDYALNESLLSYLYTEKVNAMEDSIEKLLTDKGLENVDIILNFSIENDQLKYKFCKVNLKDLVINADKQHINKYEIITEVVKNSTNLTQEEILFDEWKREKTNNKMARKVKKH